MQIMKFLDGLNLYIYAKVYNIGNGINVYDFVKSTWYNCLKIVNNIGFQFT